MALRRQPTLRVLIADDHRLFAELLMGALDQDERVEVVGIAGTGQEAVELVEALEPDLVLMDYAMPVMDGLEATRLITRNSHARVLFLTGADSIDADAAQEAGASGFLRKNETITSLRESFFEVAGLAYAFGAAGRA